MADYRKLSADLVAADGVVDDNEIKLLKKHLYAEKKIVKAEIEFLFEVRAVVARKSKAEGDTVKFDRFLLKALQDFLLEDGKRINDNDIELIKKVAGDKKIDTAEVKKFLNKLKKEKPDNDKISQIHEEWTEKQKKAAEGSA